MKMLNKEGTYHDMNMCKMSTVIVHVAHKTKYFLIQPPVEKAIENIKTDVMNVYNGKNLATVPKTNIIKK